MSAFFGIAGFCEIASSITCSPFGLGCLHTQRSWLPNYPNSTTLHFAHPHILMQLVPQENEQSLGPRPYCAGVFLRRGHVENMKTRCGDVCISSSGPLLGRFVTIPLVGMGALAMKKAPGTRCCYPSRHVHALVIRWLSRAETVADSAPMQRGEATHKLYNSMLLLPPYTSKLAGAKRYRKEADGAPTRKKTPGTGLAISDAGDQPLDKPHGGRHDLGSDHEAWVQPLTHLHPKVCDFQ